MKDVYKTRKRAKLLARKQALGSGPFFSRLTKRSKRLLVGYNFNNVV
jgi:hypothetical protein